MATKSAGRVRDLLGAHMSIAGSVAEAPPRGAAVGCRVIQIFTKSNVQWKGKTIAAGEAALFRNQLEEHGISSCLAHASYLINLCAPDPLILRRSLKALVDELRRCDLLGIPALVVHPGCHKGLGEEAAIRRIATSLDRVIELTAGLGVKILLENTAGQGTGIGYRFEHLAAILDLIRQPARIGFCFDTCHAFSAGYDLRQPDGYSLTFTRWQEIVGLELIEAFHLNDCKARLGQKRDRHEHIGLGGIGLKGFWLLLNDERFRHLPKVLETPKGKDGFEDAANLKVLRGLVGSASAPRGKPRWKKRIAVPAEEQS